ncbi:hypothetical protein Pint_11740 [Pistacia integerrima]|uniref:Uncharacterized protein n=1 Tax=Pistacia integerrima TaxID=434235 RepID=A0ACC0XFR6_9ROSI|nr:hypothetical protein Pint_11740 [Pistacia integerrima]
MDDENFSRKEECLSSILSLAMECTRESPGERINIREVVSKLLKIRVNYLANMAATRERNKNVLARQQPID